VLFKQNYNQWELECSDVRKTIQDICETVKRTKVGNKSSSTAVLGGLDNNTRLSNNALSDKLMF
jgi:hypothetical protein